MFLSNLDSGQTGTHPFTNRLVMVSGHVDNAHAGSGQLNEPSYYCLMLWGPIRGTAERPKIHHVTDEDDLVGLVATEEVQQCASAATAITQVDVRQEQRTDPHRATSRTNTIRQWCRTRLSGR